LSGLGMSEGYVRGGNVHGKMSYTRLYQGAQNQSFPNSDSLPYFIIRQNRLLSEQGTCMVKVLLKTTADFYTTQATVEITFCLVHRRRLKEDANVKALARYSSSSSSSYVYCFFLLFFVNWHLHSQYSHDISALYALCSSYSFAVNNIGA